VLAGAADCAFRLRSVSYGGRGRLQSALRALKLSLELPITHESKAIAMKLLGGLSFATAIAIVGGVTAGVVQLLLFDWWRSIEVASLTVAFSYFFARWKLKRMNLALDCTLTQFLVAAKSRRLRQ
jgi:ABC-type glucose/galactose transport system permease subunit